MESNILTPLSIWGDLVVPKMLTGIVVSERKEKGVIIRNFFIDGRETSSSKVKIFATLVQREDVIKAPAVLMVKEFEKEDVFPSLISLAGDGYIACTVDIEGKKEGKEYFTFYPDDVSYAEYERAKNNLFTLTDNARKSCWYEWSCVIKYAVAFLKGLDDISSIGVIGAGNSATALWQAVAKNQNVSSFVSLYNGGWRSYSGQFKYDDGARIQLSDDMLAYIAGIEPQSYAQYVNCPTLIVCNPCDPEFESDRVHDTLKRVNNQIKGILYEDKCARGLSDNSITTVKSFFRQTLLNEWDDEMTEPTVSTKTVNDEIVFEVTPKKEGLEDVLLFVAEENVDPKKRTFTVLAKSKQKDKSFVFRYKPYCNSKRVFFYSTAYYGVRGAISSNIECVVFPEDNKFGKLLSPIIFSGRNGNNEGVFVSENPISFAEMFTVKRDVVLIKEGAQSIKGISVRGGIISHILYNLRHKPRKESILLFDIFSKEDSNLVLKCYVDYFGERTEYFYSVDVTGGKSWKNQKLEINKIKTAEGMALKDASQISSIEFFSEKEVLINNLLWI